MEPTPTVFEDLARTRESFPIGTDDLEVREARLREVQETERLGDRRKGSRRRLVDPVSFEIDEGDVRKVRLQTGRVSLDQRDETREGESLLDDDRSPPRYLVLW